MKKQLINNKKTISIIAGLLICFILAYINPFEFAHKQNTVFSIAFLMITWWVLDAMPMPIVALLPIVLFPLLGIANMKDVTKSYSDSVVFLFMGGFFIGIAIEKWSLHKRIALSIINFTGTDGNKIILGFIIATGFLSMWLSNTATTMMMFPIAMSVIHVVRTNSNKEGNIKNFSVALLLSIAYASNFALGTIIGTPPNVAYVNYISEKFNYSIGFTDWMIVFIPLSLMLLAMLYFILVKWLFPNHIKHSEEGKTYIKEELKKLGNISIPEKRVAIVFIFTVLLWITKDVINSIQHLFELDDTIIALLGAISLFIVPSGNISSEETGNLLNWRDTSKMAWDILILFGGGIALAKTLEEAKLMEMLGNNISHHASDNVLLMIFIVTSISVFLSEVMSNVAQVIVMAPVVSSVAISLHMDPLLFGIPMTLGASCASMLPMGTPPNAIVFSSGEIKMQQMLKAGLVLNILSIVLITLFCYFLQPMIIKII